MKYDSKLPRFLGNNNYFQKKEIVENKQKVVSLFYPVRIKKIIYNLCAKMLNQAKLIINNKFTAYLFIFSF